MLRNAEIIFKGVIAFSHVLLIIAEKEKIEGDTYYDSRHITMILSFAALCIRREMR